MLFFGRRVLRFDAGVVKQMMQNGFDDFGFSIDATFADRPAFRPGPRFDLFLNVMKSRVQAIQLLADDCTVDAVLH